MPHVFSLFFSVLCWSVWQAQAGEARGGIWRGYMPTLLLAPIWITYALGSVELDLRPLLPS